MKGNSLLTSVFRMFEDKNKYITLKLIYDDFIYNFEHVLPIRLVSIH